MRKVLILFASNAFLALTAPAFAQSASDPANSQFGQRLEGLIDRLVDQIEPSMAELRALIEDWSAWHAPEVLPNGDILIRRRRPPVQSPDPVPPETEPPVTEPPASEPPVTEPPVTEPFEL